ncbi:hypothetical protein LINPERHAP1_LOCUS2325 [Linum perenne]
MGICLIPSVVRIEIQFLTAVSAWSHPNDPWFSPMTVSQQR